MTEQLSGSPPSGYIVIGPDGLSEYETALDLGVEISPLRDALQEGPAVKSKEEKLELSLDGTQQPAPSSLCEAKFTRLQELQERLADMVGVNSVFDPRETLHQTKIPANAEPTKPKVVGAQAESNTGDDFREVRAQQILPGAASKSEPQDSPSTNVSSQTETMPGIRRLIQSPISDKKERSRVTSIIDGRMLKPESSPIQAKLGEQDQNGSRTVKRKIVDKDGPRLPGIPNVKPELPKPPKRSQRQNEYYQNLCELCGHAIPLSGQGTLKLSDHSYHKRCVLNTLTCKDLCAELQFRSLQGEERQSNTSAWQRAVKKVKKMFPIKRHLTRAQRFFKRE